MRTDSISGWSMLLAAEVALAASLAVMTPLVPLAALGVAAGLLALIFMPRWAAVVALILVLPAYDYSFFTIGEDIGRWLPRGRCADRACEVGARRECASGGSTSTSQRSTSPSFCFSAMRLLTLFWVPSAARGIHQAIRVVTGFAIYFPLVNLIRDRRDFEWALTTWVLLSTVIAIIGFLLGAGGSIPATAGLQLHEGEVPQLGKTVRVTLFFTQPNGLAFFLSISVLFAVIRYYWGRSIIEKLFHAPAIVVMMLVLAATFSRKSWLGIVLGVGIVGLRFPRVLVEATLAGAGGVLLIFLSDTATSRKRCGSASMSLFFDPEVSIAERWVAWDIGLQLFNKSPLLGNGIGSFWTLSWRLGSPLLMPHNFYVYLLAEVGLIGVSLFVILAVHLHGRSGSRWSGSPNRT